MNQTLDIHISDVLTFKRCRRAWNWASPLRGNLAPIQPYAPFVIGSAVHGALRQYYYFGINPVDTVDEIVDEYLAPLRQTYPLVYDASRPKIDEWVVFVKAVLEHYAQWARSFNGPFNDRQLDFINVEQSFNVPLRTKRGFLARRLRKAGKFDGIVRHKVDNRLYLWEIKTTKSILQRQRQLDLEEQADSYALDVQEMLGEPVAGIIYTLIRKALPAEPDILKRGGLSQNKQIDTTFARYLAAIRNHHGHNATSTFIQDTYGDFLQHLLDNGNPFFERVVIKRSPEQLKMARNELYAVALEMTNPAVKIYKTGDTHCNWCIWREPCIAMQQGEYEYAERLLKENFIPNTYHIQGEDEL